METNTQNKTDKHKLETDKHKMETDKHKMETNKHKMETNKHARLFKYCMIFSSFLVGGPLPVMYCDKMQTRHPFPLYHTIF